MGSEQCAGCANPEATVEDVTDSDDLALCNRHWSMWVTRWLGRDAPCSAHLILEGDDS